MARFSYDDISQIFQLDTEPTLSDFIAKLDSRQKCSNAVGDLLAAMMEHDGGLGTGLGLLRDHVWQT